MNGASPFAQLTGRLVSQTTREINNEYHLQLIAKNTGVVLRAQYAQLRAQAQAAALNLRGQLEITQRQHTTNELLGGLTGNIGSLIGLAEQMHGQLQSIEACIETVNDTLERGFASVARILERAVSVLMQQQTTLARIADTLSRPYDAQAQELLREGQKWLEHGAQTEGREQQENWKDALRLFHRVIENEVGKQNYVAWFNIGYLRWKYQNELPEAEEAFFQAQRLGAPTRDLWHTKSLRHMAAMQNEQGKNETAYNTIKRALSVSREYASLFDAARYAWKSAQRDEAIQLLDECIEARPETIITMFAEDDFRE
jgi:tetratricopeptide (TPR) repeat protein